MVPLFILHGCRVILGVYAIIVLCGDPASVPGIILVACNTVLMGFTIVAYQINYAAEEMLQLVSHNVAVIGAAAAGSNLIVALLLQCMMTFVDVERMCRVLVALKG